MTHALSLWMGSSVGYSAARALTDAAPMSLVWCVVAAVGCVVMLGVEE